MNCVVSHMRAWWTDTSVQAVHAWVPCQLPWEHTISSCTSAWLADGHPQLANAWQAPGSLCQVCPHSPGTPRTSACLSCTRSLGSGMDTKGSISQAMRETSPGDIWEDSWQEKLLETCKWSCRRQMLRWAFSVLKTNYPKWGVMLWTLGLLHLGYFLNLPQPVSLTLSLSSWHIFLMKSKN